MNTLFTYIFKHKYYTEVVDTYELITTQYLSAYKVWLKHHSYSDNKDFQSKEFVVGNIKEIEAICTLVECHEQIKASQQDGIKWLLDENHRTLSTELLLEDYQLISSNLDKIKEYQELTDKYHEILRTKKRGVDRYLGQPKSSHTYDERIRIVKNEEQITRYNVRLGKAALIELKYPRAWKLFSKGRSLFSIPIDELKDLSINAFEEKDRFLVFYDKNPHIVSLIAGKDMIYIESFDSSEIERESRIIPILERPMVPPRELCFNEKIVLRNRDELKRAILDSVLYGQECTFPEEPEIKDFYDLRKGFDKVKKEFDEAVKKISENITIIKDYHKERRDKFEISVRDYLDIVKEGSDLFKYIRDYQYQREKRNEAKLIRSLNPKGFEALYGSRNLETCDFATIRNIIVNKISIQKKHKELQEQEKRRREQERKRQEEERIRQETERKRRELQELRSCVSRWTEPRMSNVKCFSLYNYYPTSCDWDASSDEWDIRWTIWDFKANPNRPQSESEIMNRHRNAMNEVIPDLKRVINHFFGVKKNQLTLVCIPSSKRVVTERRYKDFSERLCGETGMENGYSYVMVDSEGQAAHLGGTQRAEYSLNAEFFNGRNILLFDDVITKGNSMERFKNMLEAAGANVIGGLSIGKTRHERQSQNPIDTIC